MDGIPALGLGKQLPDSARCCFCRIGSADDGAQVGYRILPFEGERKAWAAGHELDQLGVEGAAPVYLVEDSGLGAGQPHQPDRPGNEPRLLQVTQYRTGFPASDRVGLDDAEREYGCHTISLESVRLEPGAQEANYIDRSPHDGDAGRVERGELFLGGTGGP